MGAYFTLRERAMLGDTGSNLIGALIGIWLVTTLSDPGRLIALGVLVVLTVYGEFRSISVGDRAGSASEATRLARQGQMTHL